MIVRIGVRDCSLSMFVLMANSSATVWPRLAGVLEMVLLVVVVVLVMVLVMVVVVLGGKHIVGEVIVRVIIEGMRKFQRICVQVLVPTVRRMVRIGVRPMRGQGIGEFLGEQEVRKLVWVLANFSLHTVLVYLRRWGIGLDGECVFCRNKLV